MRLRKMLGDEHKAIEAQLVELANAVEGADFPTIQRAFRDVEQHLKAHFELEECHLFNELETEHPVRIQEFREEHKVFLKTLDALITEAELHTLRKEPVDGFIAQLQRHSRREDESLYQWADELPEPSRNPIQAYFNRR